MLDISNSGPFYARIKSTRLNGNKYADEPTRESGRRGRASHPHALRRGGDPGGLGDGHLLGPGVHWHLGPLDQQGPGAHEGPDGLGLQLVGVLAEKAGADYFIPEIYRS